MSALKTKFGPGWLATALLGVANGVASLGSDGKLSAAQLPTAVASGLNFKGSYDATTALPTSPTNGDLYIVSVAGSGGGTFTPNLAVGDYLFYSSSASAWEPIYAPKTTDAIGEGTTNLFFTAARAQAAAVVNSLAGSQTAQAPSVQSVNTALAAKAGSFTRKKERFVLASGDITNQYVIASQLALPFSIVAGVQGLGLLEESADGTTGDYSVATDGVSGHSKISFLNDLKTAGATPLSAGDVVYLHYSY